MPPALVLCLGAAHWDLIGRPHAPTAPGGDAPGRVLRRPGGVALNVALALADLGRPAALAAPTADDPEGRALAEALAAAGIALHHLPTAAATGLYLAVEDGAGALLGAVADLPGPDALTPADLAPLLAAPPRAAAWVAEANLPAPVLAAIADAAPEGVLLAANPASPAKAPRLRALLPRLHLVACNRAEAEALAGRPLPDAAAAARALQALGAAEALVTDGPAPAAIAHAAGLRALAPRPRARGAPVTGAGDALLAAHLHARLAGAAPEDALAAALALTEPAP